MMNSKKTQVIEFEYRVPFPIPEATAHNTLVLPLGEKRYVLDSLDKVMMLARVDSKGLVDVEFNSTGLRSEDFSDFVDAYPVAAGLIAQEDQGVIAGICNKTQLGLARFTVDGNLDQTFGKSGKVTHTVKPASVSVTKNNVVDDGEVSLSGSFTSAALVPAVDGKFYAVLGQRFSSNYTLLRCLPNGVLDEQFNGDGAVTVTHPEFKTDAPAVVSTEDGGVVVAGTLGDRSVGMRGFLCRYRVDGSLDENFGDSGYAIFESESAGIPGSRLFQMELNHLVRLGDGGYAACGYIMASNPSMTYGLLVRVDALGKVDSSFNGGKPLLFELPDGAEADFLWGGVAEQADGKIIVAGGSTTRSSGYERHLLVVRFLADGKPDPDFGANGWMTHSPLGDKVSLLKGLVVSSEQKILLSGDGGADNNVTKMKGFVVQIA